MYHDEIIDPVILWGTNTYMHAVIDTIYVARGSLLQYLHEEQETIIRDIPKFEVQRGEGG